jgi:peptide/nickel transport system substrate-binding protein
MTAMVGADNALWKVPVGYFPPSSPQASEAGMPTLTGRRDDAAVRRALEAAGYKGEKVVLLVPTDINSMTALSNVAADMLKRVGMNVDYQATDFGTVVQRRVSTRPPAEGGWNLLCIGASGLDAFTPATHLSLRGNGKGAGYGWPNDPKIEDLRESWLDAADLATQRKIAEEIQLQAFHEVPYYSGTCAASNATVEAAGCPQSVPETQDILGDLPSRWK